MLTSAMKQVEKQRNNFVNFETFSLFTVLLANQAKLFLQNVSVTSRKNPETQTNWYVITRDFEFREIQEKIMKFKSPNNVKIILLKFSGKDDSKNKIRYPSHLLASVEHGKMLDQGISYLSDFVNHIFIIEADFLMLQECWQTKIRKLHKIHFSNLNIIGTSYDYASLKDSLWIPAAHFLSIKLPLKNKFSFAPKLDHKPALLRANPSRRELRKYCNQKFETGYRMHRKKIGNTLSKLRIWVIYLFIRHNDIRGVCTNIQMLDLLSQSRQRNGIIFDHLYTKRMKKARNIILNSEKWYLSFDLVVRKLAFDNSLRISTKKDVKLSYLSEFEMLTYSGEICAIHFRNNRNQLDEEFLVGSMEESLHYYSN